MRISGLFKAFLAACAEPVLIVHPASGRIIHCNDAALPGLGYPRTELVGTAVTDIFSGLGSLASWKKSIPKLKKIRNLSTRCSCKKKDGSLLPVELACTYVEHRPEALVIVNVRDITYTERSLSENNEKFRALAEGSANAASYAIIQINEKGETVFWNKAAETIFGYSFTEMRGKEMHKLLIPPALHARFRCVFDKFVKDGQGDAIGKVIEQTAVRKGGEQFPAEISLSAINLDGKWNAIGMIRDVTRKKNTLTALQENMERFRKIFEDGPLGMAILDLTGKIVRANAVLCGLTGYAEKEIAHMALLDMTHPADLTASVSALATLLEENTPFLKMQQRYLTKEGGTVWTNMTFSLIRGEDGKPRYFLAMAEDITEKLRLESIAGTVESMNNMGYVFSGLRHEIGNPVNAIKMTLNVLKARLGTIPAESVAEYVGRAIGEVARIESILWTMKSFNMYESLDIKPVQMRPFISDFIAMVQVDAAQKGITLRTDVSPGVECAMADPRALQQVLMNLVANSIDSLAGRGDPFISITAALCGAGIRITVADNGTGMAPNQIKELFRPFRTTKPKGTGLGLVISRKMLAGMGGSIDIESRKDEGTAAHIVIPQVTEQALYK
ncbi:MAG: PAS domain-containing sensor histidine kinase [Nitrospiraceae bacterium]|nr:PAS domain-containing sensor histidine kinase [Nitrospiraceae bacterium]